MIQATVINQDQMFNIMQKAYQEATYPLNLTIEGIKQMKTKKQLGFIFGGLIKVLTEYFNNEGQTIGDNERKWTLDDTKIKLYHHILGTDYKLLPDGTIVLHVKTLSLMSKEEASDFINKAIIWVETNTDCILPAELKYCWLMHVTDNDIEYAVNYNIPDESEPFLRYQRQEACCLHCGLVGKNEPHHIRGTHREGMAQKPPDWITIPLCRKCHDKLQKLPVQELSKILPLYGFKMDIFCRLVYLRWLLHK